MTAAGSRDDLISFYTPGTATENAFGEPIPGAPVLICDAWAKVFYSTGSERRDAAQEGASQAATFNALTSTAARSVTVGAYIQFDGFAWDIVSIAPMGRSEIEFTAVRRLS